MKFIMMCEFVVIFILKWYEVVIIYWYWKCWFMFYVVFIVRFLREFIFGIYIFNGGWSLFKKIYRILYGWFEKIYNIVKLILFI